MITFSNIPESVQRTLFDRMDMLDRNSLKTKVGDPISVEAGQPKINYMNGRSVFMRMISLQPPTNVKPVILSGGESDYKGNLVNNNWGNKKFTQKSAVYGEVGVDVGPPHMRMLEPASRLEDIVHGKYDSSGEQPYRPMPGVKDISIEYKGGGRTLAATREAVINWTCWTWQDLDRLTGHFLHHGRTVFIDWGWSGIGEIDPVNVTPFPILRKNDDGEMELVENGLTINKADKEVPLLSTLPDHIIDQRGNYDAMIGLVKDFEWSVRDDGGFDCVTTLLSLGVNVLQQNLKTASDPRLASLPMLIESTEVTSFEEDELFDREGLGVAAAGEALMAAATFGLTAQLATGTIVEPYSTAITAGAWIIGGAMAVGGLAWDYVFAENKKWVMPTLKSEFDELKDDPKGIATGMEVDRDLIMGMTGTDEAFVSYPKGDEALAKLAPYINFDHYIKDLYNQLHWNISHRTDILKGGNIIRVAHSQLATLYIEEEGAIEEDKDEYQFDELYVTWGWLEDNVLSRFFSRVMDGGNGVMGEFRSYEESPLPADDVPAGKGRSVNVPVRIRNHPKMMSTDLTKFMLFKGDAVEKFVENQWGTGWEEVEGAPLYYTNNNIGQVAFVGKPNTTIDEIKGFLTETDELDSLESWKAALGDREIVLHQFDYVDSEGVKNENWGVLRNVYFNARYLTEEMKDATSIENAILKVWNKFSEEYGGIYDFYLDFSDDQNRIIVKDRGWTQDAVRDTIDNKSHLANPDAAEDDEDKEENFNGLFEFPTWQKNSIVKSQNLSARLPDRMKLVSMYGSSNITEEEVSGIGDHNEQAGLAWGKLVAPIDGESDMEGLTPEQYKQRQLDAVIAGKIEFPWRQNRSFGSPTADINKALHIQSETPLGEADSAGVRMSDTVIQHMIKHQYNEHLQEQKRIVEEVSGQETNTDDAKEKAAQMKQTIKDRRKKWKSLQEDRVAGDSDPINLFTNFYQASTEVREGGPIGGNEASSPRGFKLINSFKQFMMKDIRGEDGLTNKFDPIIPLDFELEIDGTAGIFPGNAFQSSYLPEKYRDIACFQVVGSDQKLDSTGWTSTVKGQIRVSITKQNELLGKGKGKGKKSGQKPGAETDGDKVKDTVAPSQDKLLKELSEDLQKLDALRQSEFDELMANATVVATAEGIVPPPPPPTLIDIERTGKFGLAQTAIDVELGVIETGEFEGRMATTLYGEGGPEGLKPGDASISSKSTPGGVELTIDEYITDPDKASEIAAVAVNSLIKDYLPSDLDPSDVESLYSDIFNQMTDSTRAGSTIVVMVKTTPNPIIIPGVTDPIFNYTPSIFDTPTTRPIIQPPLIFDDTGGG